MKPEILLKEVDKFSELVQEGAFLIRTMFFLIFGFLIETEELLNPETFLLAIVVVAIIFLVRWGLVKLFKLDVRPLVFVAPRGLITILLFFKIPDIIQIPLVNKSLVIQVIVLSAIVMMVGMMICKMPPPKAGDDLTDSDLDDADRPEELENVTQEATRIEFDLEDDRFDK